MRVYVYVQKDSENGIVCASSTAVEKRLSQVSGKWVPVIARARLNARAEFGSAAV